MAEDIDEANSHVFDTGRHDHTQYLRSSDHAAISHTAAMLGTDSVGTDEIAANAVGSSELAAGAVTAGKIAVGGISAANQFASGVVDAAAIGTDAVGSAEIAANAVGSSELADNAVDTTAIQDNAVTLAKMADNSVGTSELVAASVTLAKLASEAFTDYSPNFTAHNVTLGTGGQQWGRYIKFGRMVFGIAGFALGTGGNVTGEVGYELPFTATTVPVQTAPLAYKGWITAALASDASPSARWSGIGLIVTADNLARSFATAGASAVWDANTPFDWTVSDNFASFFAFEATS